MSRPIKAWSRLNPPVNLSQKLSQQGVICFFLLLHQHIRTLQHPSSFVASGEAKEENSRRGRCGCGIENLTLIYLEESLSAEFLLTNARETRILRTQLQIRRRRRKPKQKTLAKIQHALMRLSPSEPHEAQIKQKRVARGEGDAKRMAAFPDPTHNLHMCSPLDDASSSALPVNQLSIYHSNQLLHFRKEAEKGKTAPMAANLSCATGGIMTTESPLRRKCYA